MIVVVSVDQLANNVAVSCDKPGIVTATNNSPVNVVVDVKKDGVDGLSAYDIAVMNGYIGTNAQWIQDLLPLTEIDGGLVF